MNNLNFLSGGGISPLVAVLCVCGACLLVGIIILIKVLISRNKKKNTRNVTVNLDIPDAAGTMDNWGIPDAAGTADNWGVPDAAGTTDNWGMPNAAGAADNRTTTNPQGMEDNWGMIQTGDTTDDKNKQITPAPNTGRSSVTQCPFCGCRVSALDEFCPVCSKALYMLPPKKKRGVDKGIIALAAILAAVICGGAVCVYAAMRSHSEDYEYSSRPNLGQTPVTQQPAGQ